MQADRRLFPALILAFSGLILLLAVVQADYGASLAAGFARPLLAPAHLLAMLAVGSWAVQIGMAWRWRLPAVFLAGAAIGVAAGFAGLTLPWREFGLAATVLVLGLLLAAARPWPKPAALAAAAGLGVVHGLAQRPGIGAADLPWAALGMLLGTAILLAAGVEAGLTIGRRPKALRALGAAIGAAGLALMLL